MRARHWLFCGLVVWGCKAPAAPPISDFGLSPDDVVSGQAFLTPETQALQNDSFANPGYLWVDQGATLFAKPAAANGMACQSCHQDGLKGVAVSFPKIHPPTQRLFNLESQVNYCRTQYQKDPPLAYESDDLLSLSAYVTHGSYGQSRPPAGDEDLADYIDQGRTYFMTPRGQFNLSCAQCHDQNWGQRLRGDTLSQGHGNGFPAYRFEWQSLGSLHRRFQDCDLGVRATPLASGDDTYIALELYLALRSARLTAESPAIRR